MMDYYERALKLSMIADKINNEFSGSMLLRCTSEIAHNIDKGLPIEAEDIAYLYVYVTIYLDKHGVKNEELRENIDKVVNRLFSFYYCGCDGKRGNKNSQYYNCLKDEHNTCELQEDKNG